MVLEAVPDIWAPWATKARQTNPDPRKEAFIQEYGPYAKRYGAMWNIAPEVLLGWGASESNWGAAGSIFGVKQWEGSKKAQTYDTWEAGPNGERIPQKAAFEVYDSPDEAFQALGNLLNTERYRPAFEQVKQTGDSATFLRNINDAGYATDRNWAGSVVAIANSMGDGNFPDPPPAGPGQNASSRMGSVLNGAGGETMPVEELGIRGKVARLVVQKRLDAEQARTAAVDEEARAKLETQLGRPMLDIASERVNSQIKPPNTGDEGLASDNTTLEGYPDNGPQSTTLEGNPQTVETRSPLGGGTASLGAPLETGDVPYAAGQGEPGTTLQSGQAAGRVGSVFSVAGTQRAQEESKARLAAAAQNVGGGGFGGALDTLGVGGAVRAGAGAVGGALSDVKFGMPELRVGAGGGVHSANAGQPLPQAVLLGQGQGIPGAESAKNYLEDKFSAAAKPYDFTRAAGGIGTPGGGQPLSDEGLIQKGVAQVPGAVIPTTVGQAAFNVALGAGPIEKLTGLPLDNLIKGMAARGAESAAKRRAAGVLDDIAKAGERAERAAPSATAAMASASGGSVNRAKLGNNARESRYGQIVRDSMQQTKGPEATAKMEAGLIKTGKTWADLGDSIEALAPETAPWLREPASSAVEQGSKAVKPDGSIDYDVLRKEVRQSVESVNAERAGQGAREQMQRARPAIGGEGSMLGKDQSQLRTGAQNPVQPEDIAFGDRPTAAVERMREVRPTDQPLEMRRLRVLEDDAVQRLYRDTTEQLANETNPGNQLKLDRLRQQYEDELVRRGIEPGGVPTGTTTAPEGAPLTPPERPRTKWTVTPKEGQSYTAETLAGPRSSSVEEAQQTFQSEAQRARDLGDQAKSARRAGQAMQAQEGVERLRAGELDPRVDYSKLRSVPSLRVDPTPSNTGIVHSAYGWMSPDGQIRQFDFPNEHWDALVGYKTRDALGNAEAMNALMRDGWVRMSRQPNGSFSIQSEAGDLLDQVRRATTGAPAARTELHVERAAQNYNGTVRDFLTNPPGWAQSRNFGPRPPVGGEGSIVARGARPAGEAAPASITPLPQSGAPAAEVPPVNLGKKLPAVKPETLSSFELEAPPEGTPTGRLHQPEDKAKTVVIVHNQPNLDVVGPASNNGQRVGNMWVGGLPDADTWAKMTEDAADVATIFKDSRYYAEVPPELTRLFQITDPQERQRAIAGYAMGNRRASSERAAGDVLRVEERLAGAQREGLGSMNADIIQNALNWSGDPSGVGPKLFDFEDVLQGKTEARTWAGSDPRAGRPFVADTHSSRDAGFIDPEMKRYIEKKSGKTLDELGLVMDNATDSFNPTEVQYELVSRWGNQLADDLNARNWLGKNDWLPSEIQAIGWGRVRRELGLADSGMESIRRANTFRVTVPSADAALAARGVELGDQEMRRVSTRYVENAVGAVKELIPQARFSQLPGVGLDGVHYDLFTSPETAHEVALAVSHSLGGPVITFREAGVSAKTAFNDISLPSGTFNAEQAQRLTDATAPYVRGVTYNADGSIKLIGTPTSEKGQKSLQNAIDAAFPDEELLFHAPGRGDLEVVGEGGSHADALSALERGRPDAATALQASDTLRQSWLDAALRDSGQRGPTEFPGSSAVPGSSVPAGRVEAGAEGTQGPLTTGLNGRGPTGSGITAAKQFQFVDPFHPTQAELNRFTEIGGTELLTEANRLDQVGVSGKANDWIADAATLAKRIGDPGSELRRQLQENGLLPSITGGQGGNQQQGQQPPLGGIAQGAAKSQAANLKTAIEAVDDKAKKGVGARIGSELAGAFGLPRTWVLGGDTNAARALTIMASHPGEGMAAAGKGLQANLGGYMSPDLAERAQNWVDTHPLHDFLTNKTYFPDGGWRSGPLRINKFGPGVEAAERVPEYSGMNASSISRVGEALPGVARSERADAVGRNVAGMDWAARRYAYMAQKYDMSTMEGLSKFISEMRSTVDWANHMRGYSGSKVASVLGPLNALTSPQQMVSRLQLMVDPIVFASRGDTEAAKYAAQNLLGFLAEQGSFLTAMKLAERSNGGLWSVNMNPTSTDFGQVKVGNTRIDTLAGLGPVFKLGARLLSASADATLGTDLAPNDQAEVADLLTRWFENKENPSTKLLTDYLLHHKTPDGESAKNIFLPSLVGGTLDVLQNEQGSRRLALAPLVTALQFGGIGTTTYKSADDVKREATEQVAPGKDYAKLSDIEKLPVLAALPKDAPRNAITPERNKFNDDKKAAGYKEPPKDKDGKPVKETEDQAKERNANNAQVWVKNPELDARKWFFSDSKADPDGGALHSKEAVDKVLALNLPPEREVRYASADRNLATPEGRKLWADTGQRIEAFYSDSFLNKNKALLDYNANERFGKSYGELKDYNKKSVASSLRTETKDDSPSLDALHAYLGYGGDSNRHVYLLHSTAAMDEVKKLEAKYGKGTAKPGYKWELSKDAK